MLLESNAQAGVDCCNTRNFEFASVLIESLLSPCSHTCSSPGQKASQLGSPSGTQLHAQCKRSAPIVLHYFIEKSQSWDTHLNAQLGNCVASLACPWCWRPEYNKKINTSSQL